MVFIVAEIGVNWDGNFELVKEMMKNAKNAGCDAVKFQAYERKLVESHPESSRLMNSAISSNNIETINELAKSVGIEWFCTPMYPEAVDLLDPFVHRFKIREADGRGLIENKTTPLFDKVMKTDKEIIVSCQKSPRNSIFFTHPKIKWLYCVPKYPSSIEDLDFSTLSDFHGYSNHCPMIIAPVTAAILGAKIIEVHVSHDKSANFIDNNVSFDNFEIKEMIKLIRLSERIKR